MFCRIPSFVQAWHRTLFINSLWLSDAIWLHRSCHNWFRQWLVAWQHCTLTWTNHDWSSIVSRETNYREVSLIKIHWYTFGNTWVSELSCHWIIQSYDHLSPILWHASTWSNDDFSSTGSWSSEIWINVCFKKMYLKMYFSKYWPLCSGLGLLTKRCIVKKTATASSPQISSCSH